MLEKYLRRVVTSRPIQSSSKKWTCSRVVSSEESSEIEGDRVSESVESSHLTPLIVEEEVEEEMTTDLRAVFKEH